MLRIAHCLYNRLSDGGYVVGLARRQRFTPRNLPVLISVTGLVNVEILISEKIQIWKYN
jgi:hypothetical protein